MAVPGGAITAALNSYFITDAVKPFRSGEGYKEPLVVNFPNIYTNLTVDGAG